jgi:hypothetical protein
VWGSPNPSSGSPYLDPQNKILREQRSQLSLLLFDLTDCAECFSYHHRRRLGAIDPIAQFSSLSRHKNGDAVVLLADYKEQLPFPSQRGCERLDRRP